METNTHLNAGILAKDVSLENYADTTPKNSSGEWINCHPNWANG